MTQVRIIIALVSLIAMLGLGAGIWMHGNSHGTRTTEARHAAEAEKLRAELHVLKIKAAKDIAAKEAELIKNRRQADVQITKLLEENAKLQEWWDAITPADAVDFAYGVRE